MEDVIIENQDAYRFNAKGEGGAVAIPIRREKMNDNNYVLTMDEKSKLAFFTATMMLIEIAVLALIQLVGIYRYGVNLMSMLVDKVGWSAYSSGLGIGFAVLITGIAVYSRLQGIRIEDWPRYTSVLSKVSAAMLIETPLLGQVNTYTAMCGGLGAGLENASLVGAKISEALISTIGGYAAFSILLVAYMFAIHKRDEREE
ncbi:hypothetical protein GF312_12540 [Candidatus Poribacteria bacterium]|nr:hypothetical protein [Candidatus Poribacteria bacterium]